MYLGARDDNSTQPHVSHIIHRTIPTTSLPVQHAPLPLRTVTFFRQSVSFHDDETVSLQCIYLHV